MAAKFFVTNGHFRVWGIKALGPQVGIEQLDKTKHTVYMSTDEMQKLVHDITSAARYVEPEEGNAA